MNNEHNAAIWRITLTTFLISSISISLSAHAAKVGSTNGDTAQFELFKQEIRSSEKSNPEEGERIIKTAERNREKAHDYMEHPEKLDKDLMAVITQLKINNSSDTIKEYTAARGDLEEQIDWIVHYRVHVSNATGNKLAEAALDIFSEHRRFWPIPDKLLMRIAAQFYGGSPRVKDYVLGILTGDSDDDRDYMLTQLAWSNRFSRDTDIYAALAELQKQKRGPHPALPLAVMCRLNRAKALPVLLEEIDRTTNIKTFTQDEDILSEYNNPSLLKHPLRRLKEFPTTTWASLDNPTLGIYNELLLKYIQEAEGDDLQLGLTGLSMSIGALMKSYPTIRKKLASQNPTTRRAVAKFIFQSAKRPIYNDPQIADELDALSQKEADSETRAALTGAAKRIRDNHHTR